ncbi:YggT family protein [Acidiphilium sp. AL]|uniref:YggT family protein n=1 Tax=Acidiphilium iwatense TaxID=768198 RepID=A0ABS9E0M4_9PROT|nr:MULTISPECIES: YggT family protein [Acidiphilium]MCF3947471.1 YggT family protein [Acidiphilium iwatense]MCU4160708.1 YggT family protein [Acidiphilium sp. AL]
MLAAIFWFVEELIQLYIYVMIAAAVFSWLLAFGVLDTRNRIVYRIEDFLIRATEPVLAPLRRFIPMLGGIDISFIIAFLLLEVLHNFLVPDLFAHLVMAGL